MLNLPEKIIDTHAYLGGSPIFAVPKTMSSYFGKDEFSNTRFLVMPFEACFNAAVLRQVARDHRFLGMYLMFNPNEALRFWTEADRVVNIEKLMARGYIVGLKSLPSIFGIRMDDPRYFPYYQAAEQHGMPVLLHAASSGQEFNSAEMTRRVLDSFPDLRIILAHFGGLHPRYMEDAVKLAEGYSRLYLNTTAMHQIGNQRRISNTDFSRVLVRAEENEIEAMKRDVLDIFVGFSRIRPHQVLFGSDLGWYPPEEYSLWPVDQVGEDLAYTIFVENPGRVFGTHMKKYS